MKATVLSDNIPYGELECEWGLSIFTEYGERKILLDTGSSDLFIRNAERLGIDIKDVEYGVLSHAHYDHADGMPDFFERNGKAKFYVQESCAENCYAEKEGEQKYIGIPLGMQEQYKDRLEYVSGDHKLCEGVYIIPHKTEGLYKCGERSKMYVKKGDAFETDDFAHEQSLVFDCEEGLVIFNSCSHGGADVIINEIAATFPDKKIQAIIGGFHLFDKTPEEAAALGERIKQTGIGRVVTGHCTGDEAMVILKDILGEKVEQLHAGYVMEFK
ncbi:MAG: MBL fold metallo-hydrolase [Firmicutes bacterium]|nr:MBL fold metallo-hydrolase [Bacillota bacterium]